jgi:succinyldiaminopimelate transaminase
LPGGLIDLSIGTPIDSVPPVVQAALHAAADSPGYPLTAGSAALATAITAWVSEHCAAGRSGFGVLPTIGSKELIAGLPGLLGLGADDVVVIPSVCYPTYELGARLSSARVVRSDEPHRLDPALPIALVWLNSPGNPDGRVLPAASMRDIVEWARSRDVVVASDECYLTLAWEETPVSVLDPAVAGDSFDGILAVHSLSKRSNLAGYRAGFVAGDPLLTKELLAVRKHAGLMVPAPVQAAMAAALADDAHADAQRERYLLRRKVLRDALLAAGFRIEGSQAGLYLWATRGEDCWVTVDRLASAGILAAPGAFYGPSAGEFVRFALTATDAQIAEVAQRLTSAPPD